VRQLPHRPRVQVRVGNPGRATRKHTRRTRLGVAVPYPQHLLLTVEQPALGEPGSGVHPFDLADPQDRGERRRVVRVPDLDGARGPESDEPTGDQAEQSFDEPVLVRRDDGVRGGPDEFERGQIEP